MDGRDLGDRSFGFANGEKELLRRALWNPNLSEILKADLYYLVSALLTARCTRRVPTGVSSICFGLPLTVQA